MDNRPVGVFDSGLGGLTAARKIRSILPSEDIIYFGDTSRVPYGGRSREILLKYARQDVRFLRSFNIKAIVVACEYLEPIRGSGIDTLILGCTHYPLLMDLIGEIMGPEVTLIDTGEEAAWELKRTLKAKNLLSDCAQEGTTTLYASDQPEDFGSMAKHFLQEELTSPVLQVNIDRY